MKPRKPWLAFLLGLLWPGLGHLYSGVAWRALAAAAYLLLVALPIILLVRVPLSRSIAGLGVLLASALLLALVVAVDGMLLARRRRNEPRTRWNRVWIYVAYAVVVPVLINLGGLWISEHFIFRAFRIPAAGMMDTLIVGDVMLADMRRSKLLPVRRGEIVVFEPPHQPGVLYTKRAIGLPGDTVEIRSRYVFINGERLDEPYVEDRYREGLPDYGPETVRGGHYFVLGDHRNSSFDSTDWGQLPEKLLRGKALHIYYSVSEPSDGGFGAIRWSRFGRSLALDAEPSP